MNEAFYWIGVFCVGLSTLLIIGSVVTCIIGFVMRKLGVEKHSVILFNYVLNKGQIEEQVVGGKKE